MNKDDFNEALVAYNTAMAGDAEMPPNPTGDELLKRMAEGRRIASQHRDRVLRELRAKERKG